MESNNHIKLNRLMLQIYAGDNCHYQGEHNGDKGPYRAIYYNIDLPDHDWYTIRRNIHDLCRENGLLIELDRYPKTKSITITLSL